MGDARVLDAMVSSFTGAYQLQVHRNTAGVADDTAAAITADRDARLAAAQAEQEAAFRARAEERTTKITEIRATYKAALAESVAEAQPAGLIGWVTGGDRAALTGAWSASQSDCANERLTTGGIPLTEKPLNSSRQAIVTKKRTDFRTLWTERLPLPLEASASFWTTSWPIADYSGRVEFIYTQVLLQCPQTARNSQSVRRPARPFFWIRRGTFADHSWGGEK